MDVYWIGLIPENLILSSIFLYNTVKKAPYDVTGNRFMTELDELSVSKFNYQQIYLVVQ